MSLETNLKSIKQFSVDRKEENLNFKSFLENQNSEKIDVIVQKLNKDVESKIDCVDCGNCCKNLRPKATYEALINFVDADKIEEVKYLDRIQCKHQADKKCTIYSERPSECANFPYLYKTEFVTRVHAAIQNYEICPIVFNVFEGLKTELNWKNKIL